MTNTRSDTKDPKRKILSEKSQTKNPKTKDPKQRCKTKIISVDPK